MVEFNGGLDIEMDEVWLLWGEMFVYSLVVDGFVCMEVEGFVCMEMVVEVFDDKWIFYVILFYWFVDVFGCSLNVVGWFIVVIDFFD